jgi:Tn3 transposase DDE domain
MSTRQSARLKNIGSIRLYRPDLLQSAMVHINSFLLQAVLEDPEFHDLVGDKECRALSPLFWSNVNPYGRFRLDMDTRLDLTRERVAG